jgi:hypothetical protein
MLKTTLVLAAALFWANTALGGSICGTVTDAATTLPIPGAGVFLGDAAGNYLGQYAATDAQGAYCFEGLPPGTYSIEVKIDNFRAAFVSGIEVADDVSNVPLAANLPPVALGSPWPNPASSQVNFRLQIRRAIELELSIFDARGRLVRAWAADSVGPGSRNYRWDGRDREGRAAPAGLYLVRVRTAGQIQSRPFLLTR